MIIILSTSIYLLIYDTPKLNDAYIKLRKPTPMSLIKYIFHRWFYTIFFIDQDLDSYNQINIFIIIYIYGTAKKTCHLNKMIDYTT